jgi:hypothetical protein
MSPETEKNYWLKLGAIFLIFTLINLYFFLDYKASCQDKCNAIVLNITKEVKEKCKVWSTGNETEKPWDIYTINETWNT